MGMKNFKGGKSTMIGQIPEGVEFEKIKDYLGEYAKGDVVIMGYLKTHSKKFDSDNYSLFVDFKGTPKLLTVPGWYGTQLEEDFLEEGTSAEEYFKDAFLKKVEPLSTGKGDSVSIEIYED